MLLCACIAYLFGSIPCGYLVARAYGTYIFNVGSGNPGATNVLRTLGKKPGYAVFFLDALKGLIASYIGLLLQFPYVALLSALLGHSYSCFTNFKGGKGIATLIGGLLILLPIPLFLSLLIWFAASKITHYVSVASILFAWALPSFYFLCYSKFHMPLLLFACFISWRHKSNLKRLCQGKEHHF